MATTNNYGVRQALNNKGVKNNQIGYKDGFVTVNGKNFLKPGSVANGSAMSTQQNFNNAWQGMTPTKPVSVPTVAKASPMVQAANNVRNNTTTPTFTPPTPRLEQTLNSLSGLANTQATKLPEFKYDPQSDPAYQAALREAQANLGTAQRNTNAGLRATGQGRSSYSETVANQLANRSMESIANTTLPQMMQQAYGRFIDKANYDQSAAQQQAAQLANLYGLQYQQDVSRPLAESEATGNYLPGEARTAMNNIIGLKNQAEAKGVTADQRSQYSSQADQLRMQLQAMGIDPSLYGANVNAGQAAKNVNVGTRTLQGQQADQQRKESNLNAANVVSQMTGRAVTPQDDWQGLNRQANNPNTPLTLQAQQQNFNNGLAARQQEFNEGQQSWENDFSTAQFGNTVDQQALQNAWSASDQLGYVTSELSSMTGIPQGIRTLDARKFEYDVQKDRTVASQGMTGEKYAKDYLDNQVIKAKDGDGNEYISNKPDLERSILAAPLTEYEQYKLYQRYGIQWSGQAPKQQP
ncbi:hypothetical protein [Paenibacillus peoriae]|uniref:hypothetical protein n=1 Tax=Paenibacillus peoriae TaxID=59893 RepID=UPI00096FBF88|nr:hypothetical protein [Paenibacillus peoriae]OMF48583.1 hypothetical protein BK135_09810 [Paenibacillus peoriae]